MVVYASGHTYYRHPDWLGSSRLTSDQNRNIYSDSAYGPFGEVYAQYGSADPSFTGKDQNTSSNLYDFPAREYGIQGRWPSPDPAGLAAANPADPQSWNRYSYVRNSPLNATDPTGQRMRASANVEPVGGDGDYLSSVLMADMAWGEDAGAFIFDEMMFGGPSAVDAGGLLNSPVAQHHCDGSYCMVGSYNFSTANGDGTWTVDWQAQENAEIREAIHQINQAFVGLAELSGTDPNQAVAVSIQLKYGAWVVTCPSCTVQGLGDNKGWKDPLTYLHGGLSSWYLGNPLASLFWDITHVVADGSAHVDPWGPFNIFHYIVQMPEMADPVGPIYPATCSINGGCQ